MVSDALYRRMCMSGLQERELELARLRKNARRNYDRRFKVLLWVETIQDDWCDGFADTRQGRHPDGKAFAVVKRLTPVMQELISSGQLLYETEFFPREGVFRHLLRIKSSKRPVLQRRLRRRALEI